MGNVWGEVRSALEPIYRQQQAWQAALAPILENMRRQEQALHTAIAPVLKQVNRHQEFIRTVGAALEESVRKEAEAQPRVFPYLLDQGWYVTYRFPVHLMIRFDELLQAANHEEVDRLMCDLAREGMEEVENSLRARFPHREPILTDAFHAHRERKYTLSIPVFLAQIDGIGCEVLGVPQQFFKDPERWQALDEKLGAFTFCGQPYVPMGVQQEILAPLREKWSLATNTKDREARRASKPWFGPLNRHGVLHGLDVNYPSEENSLRCVTLLEYLIDVDQILQQEIPNEVAEMNAMWNEVLSDGQPASASD